MPGYSAFVMLHVVAGTLALATFWLAAALRKGSPRHRLVGRVYLLAMASVIASGAPLALQRWVDGHPVTAAFLAYLLLIVGTTVWLAWRAIRDRQAPPRYFGRVYHALALANPVAGAGVLTLGLKVGHPLLIGFSLIGLVTGADMWRRRVIATQPRWWLQEHYRAMVANGAATHIAFLALGLPRLLPQVGGSALFYAAWFAPVLLSIVARVWLDRRYGMRAPAITAPTPPRGSHAAGPAAGRSA